MEKKEKSIWKLILSIIPQYSNTTLINKHEITSLRIVF